MGPSVAAFSVVALTAWLGYRRYREYRRAVPYDVKKSYSYGFRNLENKNLLAGQATGLNGDSGTVLEVRYRCSLLGNFADPRLVVEVGDERSEFWVERGGRGRRYLVLPGTQEAAPIRIEGRHARLDSEVRLLNTGPSNIAAGPVLIVAPHPDDAEITAYGLMRSRPADSHVVVVTTGDRGRRYETGVDRNGGWAGWLRRFDALTVPTLAGVPFSQVSCLGLSEDGLAGGVAAEVLPDLEQRLVEAIERVRPIAVVVPHPTLESHPAHLACTLATLRALRRAGSQAEALFALVHVPKARSYPLGPRTAALTLPPWYDGQSQFERLAILRLSPEVQIEKLFALEAHHDLRPSPAPLVREESLLAIGRRRCREWITGVDAVAGRDYLRRAPRPYELFLAVSAGEFDLYLERMASSSSAGGQQTS